MGKLQSIKNQINVALLDEIKSFAVDTELRVCPGDLDDKHKLHTKLLELVHADELDLQVVHDGHKTTKFTGALDQVRWQDLNLALNAVREAVTRAKLFEAPKILTELSLTLQNNGKWNLVYTLWLDFLEVEDKKLETARTVGVEVFKAISQKSKKPTQPVAIEKSAGTTVVKAIDQESDRPQVDIEELSKDQWDAVHKVAEETLCQVGGRALKKPVSIVVDDTFEFTLQGKLGAKPNRSNFDRNPEVLVGEFTGFVNEHKKHTLFFRSLAHGDVNIGFKDSDLQNRFLNLQTVTSSNTDHVECRVHTIQTVDSNGKFVYEFSSIEAANDAKSDDNLAAQLTDVNKNKVNVTSSTSS